MGSFNAIFTFFLGGGGRHGFGVFGGRSWGAAFMVAVLDSFFFWEVFLVAVLFFWFSSERLCAMNHAIVQF